MQKIPGRQKIPTRPRKGLRGKKELITESQGRGGGEKVRGGRPTHSSRLR